VKVEPDGLGLIIKPETEFEEKWLRKNFTTEREGVIEAYIKTGESYSEIVGLKVYRKMEV